MCYSDLRRKTLLIYTVLDALQKRCLITSRKIQRTLAEESAIREGIPIAQKCVPTILIPYEKVHKNFTN